MWIICVDGAAINADHVRRFEYESCTVRAGNSRACQEYQGKCTYAFTDGGAYIVANGNVVSKIMNALSDSETILDFEVHNKNVD